MYIQERANILFYIFSIQDVTVCIKIGFLKCLWELPAAKTLLFLIANLYGGGELLIQQKQIWSHYIFFDGDVSSLPLVAVRTEKLQFLVF